MNLIGQSFAYRSRGKQVFSVVDINNVCAVIVWESIDIESDNIFETVSLKQLRQMTKVASPVQFDVKTGGYTLK